MELRRLNWLQEHFASVGSASSAHAGDDSSVSLSSKWDTILTLKIHISLNMKHCTTNPITFLYSASRH